MDHNHSCSADEKHIEPVTCKRLSLWLSAKESLSQEVSEAPIGNIWMDSRKIEEGDIFLALKGEENDGHDYVEAALKQGAVAAIIAEESLPRFSNEVQKRLLVVADPLTAIQQAAREYRRYLNIPMIGITGSNGKTSTTHFLKEILSVGFEVGGTIGNWNNHIGVPLSMFRLTGEEDIAVFEMGANHEGEIETLASIVEPDMAIITNVGYAHIGYFGSLEITSKTKFELAQKVKEIGGLLLINGDDDASTSYNAKMQIPAVYFGTGDEATFKAENVGCDENGCYSFTLDGTHFALTTPGYHFVYSLLPALFIAFQMGIVREELQEKVKALKPASMRGGIEEIDGVRYIVDCYNANPSSMKVATQLLSDLPVRGKRIAIAGDMLELEEYSEKLHEEIGLYFAKNKVDTIIAVGGFAEHIVSGALEGGISQENCFSVTSADEVCPLLKEIVNTEDTVLLKGSRSIGLEKVIESVRGEK